MATNLHIDEALLDKAVKLGGGKSKRETVNNALAEYIRKREAEGLIALFGSIDYDPKYNYKQQRKMSTRKGLVKARGEGLSVIVDTSVWSLALRRQRVKAPEAETLAELLRDDHAVLLGVVRQDLLSGIRHQEQFRLLRQELRKQPDYSLTVEHFEVAAEAYNLCREKGVQGSNVDFLICAVSQLDRLPIFTTDNDFALFAKHLPITLLEP